MSRLLPGTDSQETMDGEQEISQVAASAAAPPASPSPPAVSPTVIMCNKDGNQAPVVGSPTRRRTSITVASQWLSTSNTGGGAGNAPRVAFITGASSGLGLALVKAFFTAGWKVIASCRKPDESTELGQFIQENGLIPAVPMTVSDPASVEAAYRATRELTSSIDVFVNNAGVLNFNHSPYDPVMDTSMDEMVEVYRVNVAGCLKVTQTFLPLVQASWRRPTILNISSPLGSIELNQGGCLAPYRCSKIALNMLTRTFAAEMPSVIFLAIAPREWDRVPPDDGPGPSGSPQIAGGNFRGRQAGEIKQDLRYHQGDARRTSELGFEDEGVTASAARDIVSLATSIPKEDSGAFVYTDGERVPF